MFKQRMILGKVLNLCFCFYSVLFCFTFFPQAATGSSPCGLKNINFQEKLLLSMMHYKHQHGPSPQTIYNFFLVFMVKMKPRTMNRA